MIFPILNIIQYIYTFQFINLKLSASIIKLYNEIFEIYIFLLHVYTFEAILYTEEQIFEQNIDSNENKNGNLNILSVQAQAESFTYKFTGKELDEETGYYYFGARYYDPKISIWISTDPALGDYLPAGKDVYFPEEKFDADKLKGAGGVYNSKNISLYHYAGLNPVKLIDPTGATIKRNDFLKQTFMLGIYSPTFRKIFSDVHGNTNFNATINTANPVAEAWMEGMEKMENKTLGSTRGATMPTDSQGNVISGKKKLGGAEVTIFANRMSNIDKQAQVIGTLVHEFVHLGLAEKVSKGENSTASNFLKIDTEKNANDTARSILEEAAKNYDLRNPNSKESNVFQRALDLKTYESVGE